MQPYAAPRTWIPIFRGEARIYDELSSLLTGGENANRSFAQMSLPTQGMALY
jgi:hypothetical protein